VEMSGVWHESRQRGTFAGVELNRTTAGPVATATTALSLKEDLAGGEHPSERGM